MSDIEQRLREAMDGVEEGLRLAEVGEYLYNECAYSYGDGRTEPREYGIEWQWQQAKPDEYGQGELLAASTKWHAEQAADGIGTEATKLRDTITSLRSKLEEAEGALKAAREFIADEFNDDRYEEFGEWLAPEARDVHKQLCEAEVALSALREADHA